MSEETYRHLSNCGKYTAVCSKIDEHFKIQKHSYSVAQ